MLRNLVVSIVVGLFVMAHSPAHAVCKCCDDGWAPGMLSFETGIGGGLCGQMRNFSCEGANPDLLKHACVDSGDCYLGPCITTPGFCEQDYSVTCAEDSDCAGACVEQTSGGFPIDLTCGRLYAGGGLNIVPLPLMLPDGQQHFLKVEACPHRSVMELGPATRISVGEHHSTATAPTARARIDVSSAHPCRSQTRSPRAQAYASSGQWLKIRAAPRSARAGP
jgi:hypothetical protein